MPRHAMWGSDGTVERGERGGAPLSSCRSLAAALATNVSLFLCLMCIIFSISLMSQIESCVVCRLYAERRRAALAPRHRDRGEGISGCERDHQ